jgi:TM2 domain-containing membrane protein YozV
MFCRNCANSLDEIAVICPKCGAAPRAGVNFCQNCGKPTGPGAAVCIGCGAPLTGAAIPGADKKIAAGICGILLGCLGVHKFILGYTKAGIIMLVISVATLLFASPVVGVIGLVEGIIYLTKSDEEFVRTYVQNRREWF